MSVLHFWPWVVPALWPVAFMLRRRPERGTRPRGGSPRPSASTSMKAPGTITPATGILGECSSSLRLGRGYTVADYLAMPPQGSNSTARGSSIDATAIRGANGGRAQPADCGNNHAA